MPFSPPLFVISSGIILLAFFVRALTGFGGALIGVPLLALFLDLRSIVPLMTIFGLSIGLLLIKQVYQQVNFQALIPLALGVLVGSFLGSYFLRSFTNPVLKKVLGGIVVLYALNTFRPKDTKNRKLPPVVGIIAGLTSGALGAMFGTSGPPIVMYLNRQLGKKENFRATLIGFFLIEMSIRTSAFALNRIFTLETIKTTLFLIPAFLVGIFLGNRVHTNISQKKFKQIVAGLLLISGVMLFK
ncbi:sulfite exporter TauE/SafE family protein [Patescibacteria group bacterium]